MTKDSVRALLRGLAQLAGGAGGGCGVCALVDVDVHDDVASERPGLFLEALDRRAMPAWRSVILLFALLTLSACADFRAAAADSHGTLGVPIAFRESLG